MKTLILFLLLISSLFAESKVYIGTSYGYMNESFTNGAKYEGESTLAKAKIGYGVREAYAVEFSIAYIDNTLNVYSANDTEKYGFDVDLVKAFDFGIYVNPFFKAGFGTGYLQTADIGKVTYGSFNLGLGMYIPINEHFDIEVGYDYKNLSYERGPNKSASLESNVNGAYAGVNIRF